MIRPDIKICLAAFLLDFAVMIGITAMPFFVMQHLGGAAGMLGLVAGLQATAYAITCLLSSGIVGKSQNGMRWAVLGVMVFILSMSVIPMLRSVYFCCVAVMCAHVALALIWPALHSWIGAEPDERLRGKRMAAFNISWSFGFATSPLVAGPLYDIDYRLPFVLLVLLSLYVFYLVSTLPHERTYFGKKYEERQDSNVIDLRSEVFLWASWCATAIANVLANVTRFVFTERVAELVNDGKLRLLFEASPPAFIIKGPATTYSWMAFALAFSTALTFLIMGHAQWWRYRMGWVFVLQCIAAGAFWVLGQTQSLIMMILAFACVGINLGGAFFSSTYYSLANPLQKHRRAAINEGAVGLGGVLTAILGWVVTQLGFNVAFRLIPALIGAGILLQLGLLTYRKHQLKVISPPLSTLKAESSPIPVRDSAVLPD